MITHKIGDLLKSDELVIAHGCNTKGVMGSGIALQVANKWPELERIYKARCRTGDFHLGNAQHVYVGGMRSVFNLGTQRNPGRDGSLWGIMLSFGNMFETCVDLGIERVGIPRIGCGVAGLDWASVEHVVNSIYEWCPQGPVVAVYTHPSEAGVFDGKRY